jgi:hypothetical protein
VTPARVVAAVALLAVAGGAAGLVLAGGGSDEPMRKVAPVQLPAPPAADALTKAADTQRLLGGELDALLDRATRTERLDIRRDELRRGDVVLRDVVIRKDGPSARAEATISEDELREYLPEGVELHYDPAARGPGVVFRGRASLFGASVPVGARVLARDGAVVVEPRGLPLPTTTLFGDPRLHIDRVTARTAAPGTVRVRVEGSFRR